MRIGGSVVTPDGVVVGAVEVDGDRIVAVEADSTVDSGQWVVPGFVDMHVHGGGGYTFTTADAREARGAAGFHGRHGTTTLVASLVSAPFAVMRKATAAFAPLVAEGVLAGIHFEGPYLSTVRCGAQNPAYLRDPSVDELDELLRSGIVRMMTIAPERPGARDAIARLVGAGAVAAIGHTDATYEQTRAGIAAGATVATHLFNGMRPVHHREPGPVYALLDAPEVTCELVADGVHLHDGVLAFAARAGGTDRTALITDAIAAAGAGDGPYALGGHDVVVRDGVVRLSTVDGSPGAIAGSTLTMDAALRRAIAAGLSMVDAVAMASTTPARALGLGDVGALTPGRRADLVVLDHDLRVTAVLRSGGSLT